MSTEETIFSRALAKKSAEEREAYLNDACSGDAELRANIEGLLAAHECPGGILDRAAPASDVTCDSFLSDGQNQAGTLIGPYKLLEKIGEGGMGEVYMAEQQRPVRRKVALKIIKPGMDSKQVIARFEVERQALALMDHPNIARVLDGGATESGRPYFVMELVRGIPLTDYCDQNHLNLRQRLELFVQVCRAVQHAHQKGIIHRDLKPSNVLVTLHDGTPVPKIIDFGIAKATGDPLTDHTLFTNYAQFVGTPLYMSPEQAGLSGLDVDTRSDIYSLGVLLYVLLTGTTPFDKQRLSQSPYDEVCKIIREEEPPKPSTRLNTLGQTLITISANRSIEPAKLGHLVRGDLDWVVMKALEKNRKLRYETPNALARDIERYLADETVEARPPTTIYRLRKFVRRNRARVALMATLLLGLAAVAGLLIYGAARESRQNAKSLHDLQEEQTRTLAEKAAAEDARGNVQAVNGYLLRMLSTSDPDEFGKRDEAVKLPDLSVGQVMKAVASAEKWSREALQLERYRAGEQSLEMAESLDDVAVLLDERGYYERAEKYFREALRMRLELQGNRHPDVFRTGNELALLLHLKGDEAGEERIYREVLPWPPPPDQVERARRVSLGDFLQVKGDLPAAEKLYRDWVEMQSRLDEQSTAALDAKELLAMLRLKRQPAQGLQILQELREVLQQGLKYRQTHLSKTATRRSGQWPDWKQVAWLVDHLTACEDAIAERQQPPGPFGAAPAQVPGVIQAEDFDRGGLGVGYWDDTLLNLGTNEGRYRATSVDLHDCNDAGGGLEVGWIRPGEWLAYTIQVSEDGEYDVGLRIGTPGEGALAHVEFDGHDLTGPIHFPKTGRWNCWKTATAEHIRLHKGRHVMRVVFDRPSHGAWYNGVCEFNWIRVAKSGE